MSVYRADGEGVRAATLSKCVTRSPSGKNLIIVMSQLMAFLHDASRASFYVNIPATGEMTKEISMPATDIAQAAPSEFSLLISTLMTDRGESRSLFPVNLLDAAAERFGV